MVSFKILSIIFGLASVKKGEIHDFVILKKMEKTILVITQEIDSLGGKLNDICFD